MKNPIDYFKHLIKDPVNTIEEAEQRRKKILPFCIGIIGGTAVLVAIGLIFDLLLLSCVGLFALAMSAYYFWTIFKMIGKIKKKFAILTCEKCKVRADFTDKPEEYKHNVSFKVLDEKTKVSVKCDKSNDKGIVPQISVSAKATALVEITLSCPNCKEKKTFKYSINTFECLRTEKNVPAKDAAKIKSDLENILRAVVATYESKEGRATIPFTVHSIHHPNYENRFKLQIVGEEFNGVTVRYHRTIEEMIETFFVQNDVSGSIVEDKK